jgi:hypothetical protein
MKCSQVYLIHAVKLSPSNETSRLVAGEKGVSSLDFDPALYLTVVMDDASEFFVPIPMVKQAFPVAVVAPRKKTKTAA